LTVQILNNNFSRVDATSKLSKEDLAPYSYWSAPSKQPNRTNVQLLSNAGSTASLWNITHFYQDKMMESVQYIGHFNVVTGFLSLTCVSATVVPSCPPEDGDR
jgi:hypothetical protein